MSVVSASAGAESPSREPAYPDVEQTTEPGAGCQKSDPKTTSREGREKIGVNSVGGARMRASAFLFRPPLERSSRLSASALALTAVISSRRSAEPGAPRLR